MGTRSYVDIGAVQRRETASTGDAGTANHSYVDIGAAQRQEVVVTGVQLKAIFDPALIPKAWF